MGWYRRCGTNRQLSGTDRESNITQPIKLTEPTVGWVTVILIVTTTLMFDIAQLAGSWVSGPVAQLLLLIVLVIAFDLKPDINVAV